MGASDSKAQMRATKEKRKGSPGAWRLAKPTDDVPSADVWYVYRRPFSGFFFWGGGSCSSFGENYRTGCECKRFQCCWESAELAKDELLSRGYDVVGGYMSPVNDKYGKPGMVAFLSLFPPSWFKICFCWVARRESRRT